MRLMYWTYILRIWKKNYGAYHIFLINIELQEKMNIFTWNKKKVIMIFLITQTYTLFCLIIFCTFQISSRIWKNAVVFVLFANDLKNNEMPFSCTICGSFLGITKSLFFCNQKLYFFLRYIFTALVIWYFPKKWCTICDLKSVEGLLMGYMQKTWHKKVTKMKKLP